MKKVLLALFAAGVIFAGCQKQEEVPAATGDVNAPATTEAPVVSTDTVAAPAPEAPATK